MFDNILRDGRGWCLQVVGGRKNKKCKTFHRGFARRMEGRRENNNRAPSLPHAHPPCWAVDLPGANRTTRGHEGASRSRRKCAERACCFRQPKRRTTTHCARNTHARRRPEHHQRCGPIETARRGMGMSEHAASTFFLFLFLSCSVLTLSAMLCLHTLAVAEHQ